ncbi:MAG TPA: radical SAM protein [Chitinophagaceae bacterium]|jgi:MoaA/NifB/PqqE/SkfB family radical SAM enzyme|nr:radical SAM protein [Chitinophagaceae bacterium]
MLLLKKVNTRFYPAKLFFGPEWLVLGVNNICNLHCKMCDVGTGYTQSNFSINLVGTQPLNMPLELLKQIMNDAAKNFPKVKIGYAFTEPLIYPHLAESLYYAESKKLYTSITTNALTLTKHADELCKAGLKDLNISLDGPEEIHNFIRGHKSSFQRACDGMEEIFSNAQRPEVSIFCTITEWNTGYLKKFADFFSNFPLKRLGFMHNNFTTDQVVEKHNNIYGNTYPATISNITGSNIELIDIDILWKEIQEIRSSHYSFPVTFSPEINSYKGLEIFYKMPEIFIGKKCNDMFRNIMIKSDGTVIPAHGRCYNIPIGNLYKNNLRQIWNSEIVSKFRKDLLNAGGLFPACSRCCSAF